MFICVGLGLLPKWEPTYVMNASTIIMVCNDTGYMSYLDKLTQFGIIDIDWSNAKQLWANTKPMDCQERLLTQAKAIKEYNPSSKVFVYRNLVKALPWFTDIRNKILDPNYSEWFLRFKEDGPYHSPPCTNTSTSSKCSMFYHDQLQTPQHPNGDGSCIDDCDCGNGLPCGEYLYDHRNNTLREWLINTFVVNSYNNTGLNNSYIDGFYLDDSWQNSQESIQPWMPKNGFCSTYNKFGGPTEEDYLCAQDMGLNADDVNDITLQYRQTISDVYDKIVQLNGFAWQLFKQILTPNQTECINWFTNTAKDLMNDPIQLTYTTNHTNLEWTQFEVDLAVFLLVRGDYAWIGYGWNGCHSSWMYQWNSMLNIDYGVPTQSFIEIQSGIYQRKYTKSIITFDCNTYTPSFNFTL